MYHEEKIISRRELFATHRQLQITHALLESAYYLINRQEGNKPTDYAIDLMERLDLLCRSIKRDENAAYRQIEAIAAEYWDD